MLIIALVFIVPTCGSLVYLLTRSNLDGGQKLVTLMIALAITVPVGGGVCLAFTAAGLILFWDTGVPEIVVAVWISLPASAAGFLAFVLTAAVADNRAARRAEEAGMEPSQRSDTGLLMLILGLASAIAIVLVPSYICSVSL